VGAVIQCWHQLDDEEKYLLNVMTTVQFFSVAPEHSLKLCWLYLQCQEASSTMAVHNTAYLGWR